MIPKLQITSITVCRYLDHRRGLTESHDFENHDFSFFEITTGAATGAATNQAFNAIEDIVHTQLAHQFVA